MGDVRALNVWLSLSRCGDEAPGMDIVAAASRPHRPDRHRGRHLRVVGLPIRSPRRPPARPASCGRSSSRGTSCSSTSSSCTRPRPSPRCGRAAGRSRAGSSGPPHHPRSTRRLPPERPPQPEPLLLRPHAEDRRGLALHAPAARVRGAGRLSRRQRRRPGRRLSPQLMVPMLLRRWEARRDEIRVVTGHFPLCTIELLDADFAASPSSGTRWSGR